MANEIYKNYGSVGLTNSIKIPAVCYSPASNAFTSVLTSAYAISSGISQVKTYIQSNATGSFAIYPINTIPDGKQITSLIITYGIFGTNRAVQHKPQVNIIRTNVGSTTGMFSSIPTLGGSNGANYPTTGDGSIGNTSATTLTTNQNNIIDYSSYSYMLYVMDEMGTNATYGVNLYYSIVINYV